MAPLISAHVSSKPAPHSHHLHRGAVAGERGVGGEERDTQGLSLSDEDAVERVFVDPGRIGQGEGVGAGEGEFLIAVVDQPLPQPAGIDGILKTSMGGFAN